jgi:thioredoxin-disulfide reductase
MENKYDVLIIGAGPAGLTAAIYLARNNVNVALIEAKTPGGKISEQSKIENYPGFNSVSGAELSISMFSQARENGAKFIIGKVISIENKDELIKLIKLENGLLLESKYLIIATGMQNIIPKEVINIEKFNNKGVSYCVVCDGPLFKDKVCGIIGGGNSAFEEGNYLSSIAKEVHIFVRDKIIAEQRLVDNVEKQDNIFIHRNARVLKLNGTSSLDSADVNIEGNIVNIPIKGLFPYIGFKPAIDFIDQNLLKLDRKNFIVVDENMETNVPNIFAVGDIISKSIRQITTATSDGTIAAKIINNRI